MIDGLPGGSYDVASAATRHLRIRRSRSRTPSLPLVAAVTEKADNVRPKTDMIAANGCHGNSIGMRRRDASINDYKIEDSERKFHWERPE